MSMPLFIKICKTCGKSFKKASTVSRKTWETKAGFCSNKCSANHRAIQNSKEGHYNWKGGFDAKAYYALHPEIHEARKRRAKEIWHQERLMALRVYSKSKIPFCACCYEDELQFLSIDHIDGKGSEHRRKVGTNVTRWLVKNNFPVGFQVLCYNCNFSKGHYGECPHMPKKNPLNNAIL